MILEPYAHERHDMRWVTISLTTVATVLLFIRLSTTWKQRGWFGLEDVCVAIATISLICLAAVIFESTNYGFGMHVVDIKKMHGGNVKLALKYFWLSFIFYTVCNGFTKLAFIALYYRVFAIKRFRQVCVGLFIICVCWTISFVFVSVFNCTPIHRVYDRTVPGTCINFALHRWSNATSNLVLDLIIFFLPLPMIVRLNMSRGSRIGLVLLFSIGFFICFITVIRMTTLETTLRAKEPTWESAPTNLWSFIESAVGVICSCLICLRRTFSQFWPKKWRTYKGSSAGVYGTYGNHGSQPLSSTNNHGTTPNRTYPLDLLSQNKSGNVEASVTMVSRNSSQELMIEGITVTKDVQVIRS